MKKYKNECLIKQFVFFISTDQVIIANLQNNSSYQVQIRQQSTVAQDPLWSDWSEVVTVPAGELMCLWFLDDKHFKAALDKRKFTFIHLCVDASVTVCRGYHNQT